MGKEIGRFFKYNRFETIHSNTQETCFIIFSCSYTIYKSFDTNIHLVSTW